MTESSCSPATYREAFTHEEALAFAELWKDTPTHSPNPGGLFGKLARYILASVPSEMGTPTAEEIDLNTMGAMILLCGEDECRDVKGYAAKLRALIDGLIEAKRTAPSARGSIDPVEVALNVVRDVCEIPDRTSPEDDPHMMLVRDNELRRIVHDRLMEALNAAR